MNAWTQMMNFCLGRHVRVYRAKEPLSMFIELLAGKEKNRRLLQTEGVEKGWTCALC